MAEWAWRMGRLVVVVVVVSGRLRRLFGLAVGGGGLLRGLWCRGARALEERVVRRMLGLRLLLLAGAQMGRFARRVRARLPGWLGR